MEKKYQIDTAENRAFFRDGAEALLTFGRAFPSPGGGAYYLGGRGEPWKDRNRETWITARMVHVYSIGAMLGLPDCERLAASAMLAFTDGELRDRANGGYYPGVRADGSILPDKQCYAHAFVILAASSALLAGIPGAEALLADAEDVFLRRFWDEKEGMTLDTWDTAFTQADPYRGLNANMHTVEAFLAAADAAGDDEWRARAGRIIERVIAFAEGNDWRIPEHYTEAWVPDPECSRDRPDDPFKPYGATPGHGIEWARLITQWALSSPRIDEGERASCISAAENLFRKAVDDGWHADGAPGIVYTTDWDGKPVDHDRMHWALAEAINTSAVLFRVTGNEEYAHRFSEFTEYLDQCVLDHETGSWYHQLDRENRLLETVWPGKCDLYHAFQAMLIPYAAPALSVASAVRRGELI